MTCDAIETHFKFLIGTFTSLYKFLINALPILIPAINPRKTSQETSTFEEDDDDDSEDLEARLPKTTLEVPLKERKARLSLSKSAQLSLIRKQTRRWHAALAGAIAGGCAILCEKRNRRGVIAQQLFVRGLQGSYNAFSTKHGLYVPNGDVIVFALAYVLPYSGAKC
jgi:hypothetical protein